MEQLSDIVVAQHPIQPPIPEPISSAIPITLLHLLNSDSDELMTHSQTQPYLRQEPASKVLGNNIEDFFKHVVPQNEEVYQAVRLDLSDLKYNPAQPRQAEVLLAEKLNACNKDTSPNTFFPWPEHRPPTGFPRDSRVDIAVVPRLLPLSVSIYTPPNSNPSYGNIPDIHAILACVEHTVSHGSRGSNHNKVHAYAKINELLKCPMNLSCAVLGVHGQDMTLWYGDRSGVIEAIVGNTDFKLVVIRGLANFPFRRDPCVMVFRILPSRIYKVTLNNDTFFGLYGTGDAAIYVSDGIAGKGTLVIPGIRETALISDDPVNDFNHAVDEDRVVIKFSHPSFPWDVDPWLSNPSADCMFEWEALKLLERTNVRNVPKLVHHDENDSTTKLTREAAGIKSNTYRIRTILVTQPVVASTLWSAVKRGFDIPLSTLVHVLKDIIDAHEDAWTKAGVAHCDISPGNVQIYRGRGILADWEYAIPIHLLNTPRAITSGTIQTMPPRLAYLTLSDDNEPEEISRTPWDEMCSVFLCFIYALIDERRDANDLSLTRSTLRAGVAERMTRLLSMWLLKKLCKSGLRPLYQSDPQLVLRLGKALETLFPGAQWFHPPDDADSLEWWNRLRQILGSFSEPPILV